MKLKKVGRDLKKLILAKSQNSSKKNHLPKIKSEELVVYVLDECHLLWGDLIGYVWGSTKKRVKISIANEKEKQSYYGALNLYTQEFIVKEYETANGINTVKFLEELKAQHPQQKILIIWDGASYHRGTEMKNFLEKINQNQKNDHWSLTCCLFAPYAPKENPVEAIWLQVKTFLRPFSHLGKTFKIVKRLFRLFFDCQLVNFPNLKNYEAFSQII